MDHPTRTATYQDLCAAATQRVVKILAADLRARKNDSALIIDVRDPNEWQDGIVPGALLISRGTLEKEIVKHAGDHQTPICLYCATGNRSLLAAVTLQSMGYSDVQSIEGGFAAWQAEGLEIAAGPSSAAQPADQSPLDPEDWASIRKNFAITGRTVEVLDGSVRPLIYLDHAATTHPPDFAIDELKRFLSLDYANVHRASYQLARRSTLRFEDAYRTCGGFVGADIKHHCVIFTSNTTAACEIVAHAMAPRPGAVLVTDLEHHSSDLPHRRRGDIVRVGLDAQQRLDMASLREVLEKENVKLVSVTGAANVTGWMPPIHEIAAIAHEHGALICVDAAQLIAHAPIEMGKPGEPTSIDFLVAAGHKAYAPFGAGFLVGPREVLDSVDPVVPGGGVAASVSEHEAVWLPSPDRHQFGTPNVGGAIGMSVMLGLLMRIGMDEVRRHELKLLHRMIDGLTSMGGVTLYGPPELEDRVGIVPFNVDGVSDMLTAAVLGEEFGVAVRNGRFCSHVHSERLLGESETRGAVRASIGLFNDESDIDAFLAAVDVVRRRAWKGTYTERGGQVSGQGTSRCADNWMESAGDATQTSPSSNA